ncbi:adenosine deaminase [Herbaspirillum sp. RTI4]|uniref:adenosine deaminase n=1 Tax=Herbaspirillum sp. RTI4 TaxID=3048640 RepID=UPI002AB33612|nr:adenosine deaminase [Herbaspirillum sp. RTI4]MDY7576892.1 adenosine deaminase [Herbaspirillum sp. RTI4]MEA9982501.1 adenosine deaminase [Herbaspirillum sp. RTI4]
MSTTLSPSLQRFIEGMPKIELHLHIEGTLEPELMFALAQRNQVALPYASVEALRAAYAFDSLQSFLDLYYAGAAVLLTEQDFYDMTAAYIARARADKVCRSEIFFDPQTHTERGVPIATVFAGIARALREAREQHGFGSAMIMSFLRHLPEEDAFATLEAALPLREQYRDLWTGIGLDSAERGNPPEKFARVFARCKELDFRLVAHAGEEGPAQYVRDALDLLQVERIDHGVRSEEDPALMARLAQHAIPLTVCPLSNLKLCVVADMRQHNLARLLEAGLAVTVNSDDPAYFGGYMNANFLAVAEALTLKREQIVTLARNAIAASFVDAEERGKLSAELDAYCLAQTA